MLYRDPDKATRIPRVHEILKNKQKTIKQTNKQQTGSVAEFPRQWRQPVKLWAPVACDDDVVVAVMVGD